MRPSRSIVGLTGRMPEHLSHEAKLETIEQRAMVENPMPPHPQRVARHLPFGHIVVRHDRQIARAAAGYPPSVRRSERGQQIVDRCGQRFEHRRMDRLDRRRSLGMRRDHRPHQAARSEHHRGPAAGPTHHPHPCCRAGVQIDFLVHTARRSEHDGRLRRHPGADAGRRRQALVGQFQQGLVEREIFFDRRKRQIEPDRRQRRGRGGDCGKVGTLTHRGDHLDCWCRRGNTCRVHSLILADRCLSTTPRVAQACGTSSG